MLAVEPTTEMTSTSRPRGLIEANITAVGAHNEMLSNSIDRVLKA